MGRWRRDAKPGVSRQATVLPGPHTLGGGALWGAAVRTIPPHASAKLNSSMSNRRGSRSSPIQGYYDNEKSCLRKTQFCLPVCGSSSLLRTPRCHTSGPQMCRVLPTPGVSQTPAGRPALHLSWDPGYLETAPGPGVRGFTSTRRLPHASSGASKSRVPPTLLTRDPALQVQLTC